MHGPPSMGDHLADRFTVRAVNLLRYDAHLRRRALAELRKLERSLVAQIAEVDPYGPTRTAFQQARLDALLLQTRQTIATAYRRIQTQQTGELEDLAANEEQATARMINNAVGVNLLTVSVGAEQLKAIVGDSLIEGSPAREWWGRQTKALVRSFSDQMRQGMLRGEAVGELTRRVRGTKANGFTDGIMQATRQQAQALVRSAVQGVSNGARYATFQANDDIVAGVQALAVLDARTTEICIARSGASWDLEGNPLPDSPRQEDWPGYPPWHWGCRTTLVPVLKPIDEMVGDVGVRKAAALDALPEGTQASMDGQVAADLTYEQWLRTKPQTFQQEVLGQGKWQLWQDGQLSLSDLIDQSGRPLSLQQLKDAA